MKRITAVFGAFLLLAVVAVSVSAQSGSGGFYDFENSVRIAQDLIVRDDVTVEDALTVDGDLTIADDLTLTDIAAVGKLRHTVGATQTLTADAEITNTNSYLLVSAAGSIGTADIADCTLANQGDVLAIENVANVTITITDTNPLKLSGNAVLAQWDNLLVFCDGTNWVEFAQADN
jgi:hypothetical protein